MSSVHSGQNEREVQRINSEHPPNEARTVLRNQRLLGCLSPLRAFGDARFKLSHQELTFLEDRNFDFDNDGKFLDEKNKFLSIVNLFRIADDGVF